MSVTTASVVFWISVAAVAFTYAGYPLLISLRARVSRPEAREKDLADWPSISVVLVARNEAARLLPRLENLAQSDYPAEKLEFIVVSDGSTDATEAEFRRFAQPRAKLIALPEALGKAAGINAGVAAANGELIVFADARQTFAAQTIRELAKAFADPQIGAASGELEIAPTVEGIGRGIDAYWRLERFLRREEACVDSCIGCTGAVYAIRRSLFLPLPADTILDDVVVPMQIAQGGARVAFCEGAKAFDPQPLAPELEARRKRRTLAGNFQMLFRYPAWLLPWRHRLWWQLIAHKYLRLCAPVFMLAALIANARLLGIPFYRVTAAGQIAFYICAALGYAIRAPLFSIPASFVFLNGRVVAAFWHYLTLRRSSGWASRS